MCSSGGSTAAGGPAPTSLLAAENKIFQPLPYPNTSAAAGNAYGGIGNLNTNPQAAFSGWNTGQGLNAQGGQLGSYAPGAYTGLSGAGNNYSNAFQNIGNAAAAGGAAYSNAFSNLGNVAGGSGQAAYNQGVGTNATLQGYVNPALQAGFDPLNAQYNQLFQRNQDQVNAQNARSGVATTPYGAAVADQAGANFNLDWQMQQLQREQLGAQTAQGLAGAGNAALQGGTSALQAGQGLQGQAYGQGASALQTGQGLQSQAYGQGAGALGNLYGTGASAASSLLGAGGNAQTQGLQNQQSIQTQQFNAQQQQIQDYLNYLGLNTSNAAQFAGAQNQTLGQGVNAANVSSVGAQNANQSTLGSLAGLGSLFGSAAAFL